ncbi:MAG TPA: hypothetical protein VFS69_01320 [Sphingomicrobium sp.]|nr:hypothetical protein [Sphingomicrobium sp.]
MATHSTVGTVETYGRTVSVPRLSVTGGVTAAAVFILCWLGTFVPFSSPTHAYISLFTDAGVSSARALMEGGFWSLLFGLLVGAIFALVYNAAAPLSRR